MDAALKIVEILEMILLQLPMHIIMQSRGVCHSWKDLIDESMSLQQATFRAPRGQVLGPQPSEHEDDDEDWPHIVLAAKGKEHEVSGCPVFGNTAIWYSRHHNCSGYGFRIPTAVLAKINATPANSIQRSIYLTQPPVAAITMSYGPGPEDILSLYAAGGVTLGLVAMVAEQLCQQMQDNTHDRRMSFLDKVGVDMAFRICHQ